MWISWLSWAKTTRTKQLLEKPWLKLKFLRLIKKFLLPFLLVLASLLFFYFEPLDVFSFFFILIILALSLYLFFKKKKEGLEFVVLVSLFLWYLDIYNLTFLSNLPLWLLQILIFLVTFLFFFYLLWEKGKGDFLLWGLILGLFVLEVFLVFSFWPLGPLANSLIFVTLFYFFWGVIVLRSQILPYLIVSGIILFLIIITTSFRPL